MATRGGTATTARRAAPVRRPLAAVRALLVAFCVLTLAGATSLFVLAPTTERTFAWTVEPPLTAAFLGAGYGAGFVLSVLALRARAWADVRVPYLTVLAFTWLTAAATLLHRDRLHSETPGQGPLAAPAAWLWIVVYVAVPLAMAALLVAQERTPGTEPPLRIPVPRWVRAALAVQAVVLAFVGAALFAAPSTAEQLWPWSLTPFTARVVSAWLLALALAFALALGTRDLARLRGATVACAAFGALQLAALLRFPDQVRWQGGAAAAYLVGVLAITATGVAGWRLARAGVRG